MTKVIRRRRPGWAEFFMRHAALASTRSTCNRQQVGGVVVDRYNRILVGGYNGAPPGMPHCPPDEDLSPDAHCPRAVHAEKNIVSYASRIGARLNGGVWYLYPFGPCLDCQKVIITSGAIGVVIWSPPVRDETISDNYVALEQLRLAHVGIDYFYMPSIIKWCEEVWNG